eukprot:358859-Chlamydomonas_euryale.AAC.4
MDGHVGSRPVRSEVAARCDPCTCDCCAPVTGSGAPASTAVRWHVGQLHRCIRARGRVVWQTVPCRAGRTARRARGAVPGMLRQKLRLTSREVGRRRMLHYVMRCAGSGRALSHGGGRPTRPRCGARRCCATKSAWSRPAHHVCGAMAIYAPPDSQNDTRCTFNDVKSARQAVKLAGKALVSPKFNTSERLLQRAPCSEAETSAQGRQTTPNLSKC